MRKYLFSGRLDEERLLKSRWTHRTEPKAGQQNKVQLQRELN